MAADEVILAYPERLALMLRDVDEAIVAAYHLTQDNLEYLERPCFLINIGDAEYDLNTAEQAFVTESVRIEFIGTPFTAADQDYQHYYELQARQIAAKTVTYLLKRPNLQFPDQRGLVGEKYPPLEGVMWFRLQNRSAITIMNREGEGTESGFWGFTLNASIQCMLTGDEDEEIIAQMEV